MLSMFRVGLIGFGGGSALIPLIEQEVVTQDALVSDEEYEEDVLGASVTPGALPVEIAGGIGRRCIGTKGLLLGSLAMVLPGVVLTLLLCSVISVLSDSVLMQIRFLAVGVTAFIACMLTEYMIASGKQEKENGIFIPGQIATFLVFALTCGKNLYRLLGIAGKPPVVLSTIQVFGIAFVLLILFGKRGKKGEQKSGAASDRGLILRTAKEIGIIAAATALILLAACIVVPGMIDYAAKGFLSSLMSFGGGDAYLTVADGLFVQTGIIKEVDFYSYLVPVVNILPGSILCKTLAGVGYYIGLERMGSAPAGILAALAGLMVSLLASCGIFDVIGCFQEKFREMYVMRGIRQWIRPIVSGLMLNVILSLIVQNRNLGAESGLGVIPLLLMPFIYGVDMVLIHRMKIKNGMIVFLSALTAFIVCNLCLI